MQSFPEHSSLRASHGQLSGEPFLMRTLGAYFLGTAVSSLSLMILGITMTRAAWEWRVG